MPTQQEQARDMPTGKLRKRLLVWYALDGRAVVTGMANGAMASLMATWFGGELWSCWLVAVVVFTAAIISHRLARVERSVMFMSGTFLDLIKTVQDTRPPSKPLPQGFDRTYPGPVLKDPLH